MPVILRYFDLRRYIDQWVRSLNVERRNKPVRFLFTHRVSLTQKAAMVYDLGEMHTYPRLSSVDQ